MSNTKKVTISLTPEQQEKARLWSITAVNGGVYLFFMWLLWA